jgi:hypothetical protein
MTAMVSPFFLLSMSSHPLLPLFDTSIYRKFDEDCGNSFEMA